MGDVAVEVARLSGFRSTGAQLKQTVQNEMHYLVRDANTIELRNDKLIEVTFSDTLPHDVPVELSGTSLAKIRTAKGGELARHL